jgi:enoyl-CoA hydratase/carnithine racemase
MAKKRKKSSAQHLDQHAPGSTAPLVVLKDVNLVKFQDILGLKKAKWLGKLVTALETKLLGIVPSVVEPALAKWKTKAKAFNVREIARAQTDAASYRAREMAKAQAYALITSSKAERAAREISTNQSAPDLYERTVERIRSRELGHQQNLEEVISIAVEHVLEQRENSIKGLDHQPIGEEWIDRWIDAAKWASASSVRELWAKILSAETRGSGRGVSLQLVETLRLVDEPMASFFSNCGSLAYFARFVGLGFRIKEAKTAGVARLSARRLALAGLLEELSSGKVNIFFQSCVVHIEFESLHFDTAYRLTELGNELFESLHPNAAEVRDAHREMAREILRTPAGNLHSEAKKALKELDQLVSQAQFEEIAEFLSYNIFTRKIEKVAIYRLFPQQIHSLGWVGVNENEFSSGWSAMYHEAIVMRREGRAGKYLIEKKLDKLLEEQMTDLDRQIVAMLLESATTSKSYKTGQVE